MQLAENSTSTLHFNPILLTEKNKEFKKKQKANLDNHHPTLVLRPIPDGTPVWITSENKPIAGTVLSSAGLTSLYIVETSQDYSEYYS